MNIADNLDIASGIDVVDLKRMEKLLTRNSVRFKKRVYTPSEVTYCQNKIESYAARFAAKEAVLKALGTGMRGIAMTDIEILTNENGQPSVFLHAAAEREAKRQGWRSTSLSITHDAGVAVAVVTVLKVRIPSE